MCYLRLLVVVVMGGGSTGYEFPQSCGLRGHVWLRVLYAYEVLNAKRVTPFPFISLTCIMCVNVMFDKVRFLCFKRY